MTDNKKNSETLLGDAFFNQKKWDEEAPYYDLMNKMEKHGTEMELELLPLSKDDIVLDIGCGPGRMTVPLARRVKEVYAVDFSASMIDICKRNCENAGITNAHCLQADWQNEEDLTLFPKVDVIVQARWSAGSSTLEKYRRAARKCVVIIEWAKNPPRIARDTLFRKCYSEDAMEKYPELRPFDELAYSSRNETKNAKEKRDQALREELREAGIEMHSQIIEEGWRLSAPTREEAVSRLILLSRCPQLVNRAQFEKNLEPYLKPFEGEWRFYMPTWAKVEWFYVSR